MHRLSVVCTPARAISWLSKSSSLPFREGQEATLPRRAGSYPSAKGRKLPFRVHVLRGAAARAAGEVRGATSEARGGLPRARRRAAPVLRGGGEGGGARGGDHRAAISRAGGRRGQPVRCRGGASSIHQPVCMNHSAWATAGVRCLALAAMHARCTARWSSRWRVSHRAPAPARGADP